MKQVAGIIGISPSALSQKCAGRISFKSEEIANLAEHFGVSSDVLLGRAPLEVK
ncbi:MAG: helix-turn-helix domain-containing protein [Bifidobacterium bifidum]|nr:helix-turn-helix domain-containing protein [Bifidobacterium bifidum]MDU5899981.1 helix-turn-helix domain-containing protein [Bifidobacterium sp.]